MNSAATLSAAKFPELSTRLRSAAVLIVVTLAPLILGWIRPEWRWTLSLVAFGATIIGAIEYARMAARSTPVTPTLTGEISTATLPTAPVHLPTAIAYLSILGIGPSAALMAGILSWQDKVSPVFLLGILALVFVGLLATTLFAVASFRRNLHGFEQQLFRLLVGVIFICGGGVSLMVIPLFPGGPKAVFWLLLVVCCSDSAAYFIGNIFKGPKLAPAFSPGKTISGAIGGLCIGGLIGALTFNLVGTPTPLSTIPIAAAVAVSLVGQVGDLLESGIKRLCGVKDSGSWIPGHGGLLDRVDAIFFAAPVVLMVIGLLDALHLR